MKRNLRLSCLIFLIFFLITAGFPGMGCADVDTNDIYNYSNVNEPSNLGKVESPITEYPIWGYIGKDYNFTVENLDDAYKEDPSNTTMVFYWNCLKDGSYHDQFLLNDPSHLRNNNSWICNNTWNKTGNYSVAVGIFKLNSTGKEKGIGVSYWIPIEIVENTTINVQDFFMLDEKDGVEGKDKVKLYNNNSTYCGYVDDDYSFSVKLNATSLGEADNRTINETTTIVKWEDNDTDPDNSILGDGERSPVNNTNYITWNESFTHQWDETGKKNISVITYHWDPLDGNEIYTNPKNTSILIVRDPKNFFSSSNSYLSPIIGSFSNLQNKGLFLSFLGLMILFFTYTKNDVPVQISLFGLKPFYLRSVNSFIGTFTFIAGMYLYFVFGRCPWDIPIVSSLDRLSNMYFGVLYYDYNDYTTFSGIPCLSILLGLIDVLTLSLVIHLIAIPLYKGEMKFEKLSRIKSSSASVQSKQGSFSIEEKKHYDN